MKKILFSSLALFCLLCFASASMAVDATYGPKIYKKSGGDEMIVASGGVITVESGGSIVIGGSALTTGGGNAVLANVTATAAELNLNDDLPATFTFTPAAGASNVCEVTIQAKDAAGTNMTRAVLMLVYLSDASTGIGVTGTAASGAVTAKAASGTDFGPLTAKKVLLAQTKADGTFILSITDSSKTLYYVCAVPLRGGAPSVSAKLITGNYGS